MNHLELYDRAGRLIRRVAVNEDAQDATKRQRAAMAAMRDVRVAQRRRDSGLRGRRGTGGEPSILRRIRGERGLDLPESKP
jgi:hypothetical protein